MSMGRPFFHTLVLVLLVAAGANAQSVTESLNGGPQTAEGDLAAMVDTAIDSFRRRAQTLSADGEFDSLIESRAAALRNTILAELQPLRMDGFLDRKEASQKIGAVCEASWLSLEEAVEAQQSGYRIPPRPTDYESNGAYIRDMVRYAAVERNALLDYLVLIGSITSGVILAWLGSRLLGRFRTMARDRDYDTVGSLIAGVRGPLYVTLALAGVAVGVTRFWLPRATEQVIWQVLALAFLAATLWLAWTLASLAARALGWMLRTTYREPDDEAVALIRKCLHLAVLAVFAVIAAEVVFGVELRNVLIGLGVIGLAITLAAQDSLKNLFGSLTIVMDRPFHIGDLIKFKGYFGRVEDIGFRSTQLRELDGHLVTIPNAEIVREPVENIDARPWVRRRYRIQLRYDSSPAKLREAMSILEDVLSGREDEPDAMKTHIVFEGFGESTLNLLVQYCITPGDYWDALERASELHLEILDRFNEAGVEFAFPTRTALLETDDARLPRLDAESRHDDPSRPENDGAGDDADDADDESDPDESEASD